MAKKNTLNETGATVGSKASEKIAAEVLKQNPDIKEVHVTSDGAAFYTRNDAQNHANTLQNREVFSGKRAESVKAQDKASKGDTETEVDELTGAPIIDEPENADA